MLTGGDKTTSVAAPASPTVHSVANEEGRRNDDPRMTIKALAWYLHRGNPLEVHEPMVRGSKGPSRDSRRSITFTVGAPGTFDAIRWELIKEQLRKNSGR